MNMEEKRTASKLIFDGRILHVYVDDILLPNGQPAFREYIKHVGAVCILPLTDEGDVILERQYRYPIGRVMTEIPAGKLDSAEEDPLEAALRELREETGIVPREMICLGEYYGCPALLRERIVMFLARGLSFGEDKLDPDEFLEVFRMPLDKAVEEVLAGHIADGKTQVAVLRAAMMKQRGEI